jgi:thiazole synthase
MNDILKIGKYELNSRLIVGSGKYKDFQTTKDATIASGSEMITVAVRRVNITNPHEENLMDYFKDTNIKILPNSAGCFTAEDAITTFRLVREATGIDIVKLEV